MFISCGKFQARELSDVCHVGDNPLLHENHSNGLSFSFCFVTPLGTKSEIWGIRCILWIKKLNRLIFLAFLLYMLFCCSFLFSGFILENQKFHKKQICEAVIVVWMSYFFILHCVDESRASNVIGDCLTFMGPIITLYVCCLVTDDQNPCWHCIIFMYTCIRIVALSGSRTRYPQQETSNLAFNKSNFSAWFVFC